MFQLWMIIYVMGALIGFAITYISFFVKKKPPQSRKLFGILALLFGVTCSLDFMSQVFPARSSIYVQSIALIVYPFVPFIMMLIPLTIHTPIKNIEMLKIMIFPLLIGLFSFIGAAIIYAEEVSFHGIHFVKLIYNTDIYSAWLLLNFIPLIFMYYFFYKMFKSPELRENNDALKRLKIFLFAMTIIIVVCYGFAIAESVIGTPPVSSIGNAIGLSLAMAAFKLRNEQI